MIGGTVASGAHIAFLGHTIAVLVPALSGETFDEPAASAVDDRATDVKKINNRAFMRSSR